MGFQPEEGVRGGLASPTARAVDGRAGLGSCLPFPEASIYNLFSVCVCVRACERVCLIPPLLRHPAEKG